MSGHANITAETIANNQQLKLACQQWQKVQLLALDTEFIRTDTFYPIAGLLQLSDGERCYLLDPLTIDEWEPFVELLQNENIVKVLHSCSEDLEVFDRLFSVLPTPLFDTQIAAAMLGFGFSLSYQNLVEQQLGIHVEKGETRSNWLQRPLSESQKHYAILDVEYLPEIYQALTEALDESNKLAWLQEECRLMTESFYQAEPYYKKVKSAWKLSAKKLLVLDKLTQWREKTARRDNVPRGRVLDDRCCFAIVDKLPSSKQQLSQTPDIRHKTLRLYSDEILSLIDEAKNASAETMPAMLPKPLPSSCNPVLKQLKAHTLETAKALNTAPEVLVKKRDYEALLRSGLQAGQYHLPKSLSGWRKPVIGDALLALCQKQY